MRTTREVLRNGNIVETFTAPGLPGGLNSDAETKLWLVKKTTFADGPSKQEYVRPLSQAELDEMKPKTPPPPRHSGNGEFLYADFKAGKELTLEENRIAHQWLVNNNQGTPERPPRFDGDVSKLKNYQQSGGILTGPERALVMGGAR